MPYLSLLLLFHVCLQTLPFFAASPCYTQKLEKLAFANFCVFPVTVPVHATRITVNNTQCRSCIRLAD